MKPAEQEQPNKIKDTQQVIAYLAERFPACFSVKGEAKPLKIGIFQDLAQALDEDDKVSRTSLRAALRKYTSSWRYLESVKVGSSRVNLQGEADSTIEAEHAEHAQKQLLESKQRVAERRKQQKANNPNANKKPFQKRKFSSKKEQSNTSKGKVVRQAQDKPKPKVQPISGPLTVGMSLHVSLGNSPVKCTLREINGDDVVVETMTGMTIKTEKKNLV
ncbi:RNA chaperone ProQ [Catenovulum sediminis]|uniref:RNA chaperone ProQ n=2 Tax=Catenovulum sediminis TaxID=1740262 RepID=A0ABV1RIT5_9ALTE